MGDKKNERKNSTGDKLEVRFVNAKSFASVIYSDVTPWLFASRRNRG